MYTKRPSLDKKTMVFTASQLRYWIAGEDLLKVRKNLYLEHVGPADVAQGTFSDISGKLVC